jgi:large subunit ribosomal protein L4
MEAIVYNKLGQETDKKVVLKDEIFGIQPNDHAIYLDVKRYMAAQRQGTHEAKEKSQLSGSTRKLKRQKGTGTARAGSIKSPLFKGGARIFGPRSRDYDIKINQKVKLLARKSALSYKAKEESIKVVEDFTLDTIKTKDFVQVLNNLKIHDKKSLIVLSEQNKNLYLSSRNFKGAKITTVSQLNTYDILNCSVLLFFESSVEKIEKILNN